MNCKANPAAYVFVIMPIYEAEGSLSYACITVSVLVHQGIRGIILLACPRTIGVIIFTYEDQSSNGQNAGSSPERDASSTTGKHTGPVVSGGKLLRSAGSDAGQVRDAAPGSERRDADQHRRRQFWSFPSGLLQGPTGFCSRGSGGPYSPTARPETRPQVDRGGSGLCEAYSCGGTGYDNAGAGAEDSEEVFLSGAPQDRRASSGEREKKTEQAIAAERECRRSRPTTILTEHYERLRGYVLARNNSSSLRLGLGALMSRGMAAWMQVAGELVASARSVPLCSTEAASVPQLVLDEVIRLMGSAVMTLVSGGSL